MSKSSLCLCWLMMVCFLLTACSSAAPLPSSSPSVFSPSPSQEAVSSADVIADKHARIVQLEEELNATRTQIASLQKDQESYLVLQDKVLQLLENSQTLFKTVLQSQASFPLLEQGDPLKTRILEAIDFNSPLIQLNENELILSAGMAPVTADQTTALVEMTVYQQADTIDDVHPLRVMFLTMEKKQGHWTPISFQRTN